MIEKTPNAISSVEYRHYCITFYKITNHVFKNHLLVSLIIKYCLNIQNKKIINKNYLVEEK